MPSWTKSLPAILLAASVAVLLLGAGIHVHDHGDGAGCLWCVVALGGAVIAAGVCLPTAGRPVVCRLPAALRSRVRGGIHPLPFLRAPPACV